MHKTNLFLYIKVFRIKWVSIFNNFCHFFFHIRQFFSKKIRNLDFYNNKNSHQILGYRKMLNWSFLISAQKECGIKII
jgi:hypothetical protein